MAINRMRAWRARPENRERENRRRRERRAAARARSRPAAPARPELSPGADAVGELIAWAESVLVIPAGRLRGKRFKVAGWQADWLRAALSPGVMEAGLSVARKNGKSGLVALAVLGFLCGPLNRENWRGAVTSLTGKLAGELLLQIREIVTASGLEGVDMRATPAPGVVHGGRGARCEFLAADKATGHAVGVDLAIIDEAGLLDESKRALWNAMLTSTSGRDGRLWCISIRGDGPMFAEMESRAGDRAVHWKEYAAAAGAAIDDTAAWAAANPGMADGIKSPEYMQRAARRALALPSEESAFRAYDLNQAQSPERETICSVGDWHACIVSEMPARRGPVCIGLDMGGSASMTALCACWPETGRLEVYGAFPATPGLAERGLGDGVGGLYIDMHRRGELRTYPGRVTPVRQFLGDCRARLAGERVAVAGADRYRRAEVLTALESAGANWPMQWRGVGAAASADGSADVRAFQRAVLEKRIKTTGNLLLESAIAESALRYDGAGNPALDKRAHASRIDALQAAVIAVGLARLESKRGSESGYRVVTV